jgi:hypothetical protein
VFEVNLGMVVAVGLLTLFAICSEALRKVIDLHFVPWMMHKRGVEQAHIQAYIVKQATKQRENLVIQVLKLFRK